MGEATERGTAEYKWSAKKNGKNGLGNTYRWRREEGKIAVRMSEKVIINLTINSVTKIPYSRLKFCV